MLKNGSSQKNIRKNITYDAMLSEAMRLSEGGQCFFTEINVYTGGTNEIKGGPVETPKLSMICRGKPCSLDQHVLSFSLVRLAKKEKRKRLLNLDSDNGKSHVTDGKYWIIRVETFRLLRNNERKLRL